MSAIETVRLSPARGFRSAVDMSRMAPFTDAAGNIDRTNWGNLFISYYTWGEVLGLGLDLLLRLRSADQKNYDMVTLDDYMQLLWRRFGRSGDEVPGVVSRPFTQNDARTVLAELTSDQTFADDFFDRYVEGHEVIDYEPLFERAGLVLRRRAPGRMWLGSPLLNFGRGGAVTIAAPVAFQSVLYDAGLERDDVLVSIDGRNLSSVSQLEAVLRDLSDGDQVSLVYSRHGEVFTTQLTVEADPRLELIPLERLGRQLTPAQERFRYEWLGSKSGP